MSNIFITGIGTEVGKTVVSAVVVEALKADYWKPIQAGDLTHSDTDKVKALVSNRQSKFYANAFALKTPMSPHAAAEIDGVEVSTQTIKTPDTSNTLVIEGAGGILVPINNNQTILDLIKPDDQVIVVSRHYLGSINHTLLTIDCLKNNGLNVSGIIFNGNEHRSTESIIKKMSGVPILGRINEEPELNATIVKHYATILEPVLKQL